MSFSLKVILPENLPVLHIPYNSNYIPYAETGFCFDGKNCKECGLYTIQYICYVTECTDIPLLYNVHV